MELVKIRDVYDKTHYVSQEELAGQRTLLHTYRRNGQPAVEMAK